ncbi:MAG: AarF/ABC1/UbiB kinase family protein [Methanobrevibacter sp.]|uniref:ABC1 kinase family protein n=1 Tax=Methanobrevibacter sp. TaxID=66852 RepID=UPI0025DF7DBA|nr:AarF/UbiB family protein [Methanobrevibacter sp.]MBQ2612324.1 AarF/ABC1/UbiB kinase family protein [Methanobrevibacter sp.]MEE0025663.1 AarF/UbiB family protein [Methanobrevibacter sp.]
MSSKEEKKKSKQRRRELYSVARKYHLLKLFKPSKNKDGSDEYEEEIDASNLRLAFEELGPTFIKLGQILCTRPDLVGNDIAEELTKLRDNTPVTPFEEIKQQIEEELEQPLDEIYSEFDEEAIGSASIGQVYRAKLKENGEEVAVKVQKPGSYETVVLDLSILKKLAYAADKYITRTRTFNLPAIMSEFERSILKELDYMEEVMNIQKITKNFEDEDYVKFPKVYTNICSPKLINMEFVKGYNVTELYDKEVEGIDNIELADDIVNSYFKQLMLDGFFHADPHPGNLIIGEDGILCYIDLGMMGILSEDFRSNLAELLLLLFDGNSNNLIKQLMYMKIITPEQNTEELRMDIDDLLNRYMGAELDQMDGILSKLIDTMIKHGVTLPREFVMIGRGVALIEDIGYNLNPNFNATVALKRLSKRLMFEKFKPTNIATSSFNHILEVQHLLKDLPDRINSTLNQIEKGELEINMKHEGLNELKNQMSASLIIAALIIGSSLTILADSGPKIMDISAIGFFGFAFSAILGAYIVIKYVIRQ